ncbi:uncharacterized protein LOC124943638 [Impatiens glandulifera]|uniref:uncharacterized protein LOC124943638 n=1 Tax=Impatiens glandulifera TaxID=253017 RepID=UPI001FB05414|nr:uncharacterized protein LOC124943638 [Impatiens glandulifera]
MDFWLAIAAATACYMAKQLKVLQDSKCVKVDEKLSSEVEQDDSENVCSHCNNNIKLANISDYYENDNVFSISSLFCSKKFENSLPPEHCRRDSKGRRRNSLSIRRSNAKSTKTTYNSLESCLKAQLINNEIIGMEDYVICSGRKIEARTEEDQPEKLTFASEEVDGEYSNPPIGTILSRSSHKAALFILGISLGIVSSSLSNRREVDKLNRLLNQTENLVQDLQEELELKDSLTVKELVNEDHDSQEADDSAKGVVLSCKRSLNESPKHDHSNEQRLDEKGNEHSEAIAKIEAELEAELELLELNLCSSSLEGKLTQIVDEKDQDFIAGLAEGEIFDRQLDRQPYADRDGSGFSTTHSMHDAVNPHELSLCLHQIIQSKLEERIRELETALEKSEKKKVQTEQIDHDVISWANPAIVINLSEEASDTKEDNDQSSREQDQDILLDQNRWTNQHYLMQCYDSNELPTFCSQENENFEDLGIISEDENDDYSHDQEELLIKKIVERAKKGSVVALVNAQKQLDRFDQ